MLAFANCARIFLALLHEWEPQSYAMSAATKALTRQMLEWIAVCPRDYAEVMDAWRTSCPKLPFG